MFKSRTNVAAAGVVGAGLVDSLFDGHGGFLVTLFTEHPVLGAIALVAWLGFNVLRSRRQARAAGAPVSKPRLFGAFAAAVGLACCAAELHAQQTIQFPMGNPVWTQSIQPAWNAGLQNPAVRTKVTDARLAMQLISVGRADEVEEGLAMRLITARSRYSADGYAGCAQRTVLNSTLPERFPLRTYRVTANGPNYVAFQPVRNVLRFFAHWRPMRRFFFGW